MITANEGSRHKAYAEYLGVIDYIRKPFAMERLLEAVNKAFDATKPKRKKKKSSGAMWMRRVNVGDSIGERLTHLFCRTGETVLTG